MEYVVISQKKVPVAYDVDILVAGGGCAGVGAAIAGARSGAKTLVVERMFYLGGMMTGGLMSKIALCERNNGLAKEIIERFDEYQHTHFLASRPEIPIDPEAAKRVLDKMVVEEAGAQVLFGTSVTSVVMNGRHIDYVIINGLNGEEAVKAKFFIDCTGDGQLAYVAGADHMVGNDEGYSSSPTMMFRVANVDIDALITAMEHDKALSATEYKSYSAHEISPYKNRENIHDDLYAHFADFIPFMKEKFKEYPLLFSEWEKEILLRRGVLFMNQPEPNHVLVNCTRINEFKGNDSQELTNAVIEGRRQCECVFKFMKRFLPGFEHSFLVDTASLLGIRESRRIQGDYIFTQSDVDGCVKYDDGIVSNHGGIEIHNAHANGTDIRELSPGSYYSVPYRCIIAKDFDNLYMAGRCFSASHEALSAARNIAYCIALGNDAATAASMLTKSGEENMRKIDIGKLREKLAAQL